MGIRYESGIAGVSWERIAGLIEAVGWPARPLDSLQQAFANSSWVRIAYHGDTVVGFGRTADDGMYYGMVVDLVVDPRYQRRGIGSEILRQLREEMERRGLSIISLVAARGSEGFYHRAGWKRSQSAFHWSRKRGGSS